jgi:asparagine synthase (glutamine-hydrolysing)
MTGGDAVRKAAAAWRSPNDFPHAYYFTRLLFTPSRVSRLIAPYFESIEGRRNAKQPLWRQRMEETARQARSLDSFNSVSCLELQSYMVNTLLRDTDSVSMANSLEVRVPLIDHRLVEFMARLPKSAKFIPGASKALLVEALSDLLPDNVVSQEKRTFTLPWEVWLRGPLGVNVSQSLAGIAPELKPYMNPRAVRGAWQNFIVGQTNWSRPWSLYVLNEWIKRHVTGAVTSAESTVPALQPAAVGGGVSDPRT